MMWRCCDSHNHNCEPPSELCCHECPEARHAYHANPGLCVLTQCDCQKCDTDRTELADRLTREYVHLALKANYIQDAEKYRLVWDGDIK